MCELGQQRGLELQSRPVYLLHRLRGERRETTGWVSISPWSSTNATVRHTKRLALVGSSIGHQACICVFVSGRKAHVGFRQVANPASTPSLNAICRPFSPRGRKSPMEWRLLFTYHCRISNNDPRWRRRQQPQQPKQGKQQKNNPFYHLGK